MKRLHLIGFALASLCAVGGAHAASVLIRNATVHTQTSAGVLKGTDVLIEDGVISAIGASLAAGDAQVIDAKGQPLTPGLFGGLSNLGVHEIGLDPGTEDGTLRMNSMRPEFDVTKAYNPDSVIVGVNRVGGITFTALVPVPDAGGSIIAGEGAIMQLDGTSRTHSRILFVQLGGAVNELSGGSRAGQFMLLRQAIFEARNPNAFAEGDERLLTPFGRQVLKEFLDGAGVIVFDVDRAADIRQVLDLARREKLRIALAGAAEAWRVAPELASAKVPVLIDALENLPYSFDSIGATLENAARLEKAGVRVAFTMDSVEPHNLRKLRQVAGNAVAHGMSWDAALAGITRVPAEIFGVDKGVGTIERGRRADLVLWSGDPLEVTSLAERVFVDGALQSDRSRQMDLRDRYVERVRAGNAR
ncbi:MAG TPA: amidohydrolase family protein [Steroidobacteraceae bacterium]|nr:amidohydrolase family protein [Steroidobacteraceae bacterium]